MIDWIARRRRPGARFGTAVGAATIALLAALWPLAPAQASSGPHTVTAFTHFQDDGSVVPSSLPCPDGQAIRGDATFGVQAGDTWHGTSVYDLCLVPTSTPNAFTFTGTETFTGIVDGCGTGSMTYALSQGFVQLSPNPTTPNGFQRWSVVPGTGTGGLAGVAGGSGVGIFTIELNLANEGFFAGLLTC